VVKYTKNDKSMALYSKKDLKEKIILSQKDALMIGGGNTAFIQISFKTCVGEGRANDMKRQPYRFHDPHELIYVGEEQANDRRQQR